MPILSKNQQLKTYQVNIGGHQLKLKSNHDAVTFDEIVQLVEKQFILSSKGKNQNLSVQKALILSCLNVAEELVCLKKILAQKLGQLESSVQSIFSKMKSSSYNLSK